MKKIYILDACALLAFLLDEEGAEKVESILEKGNTSNCTIYMHKLNVLEIYYGVYREEGKTKANEVLDRILALPIKIINELDDSVFKEAGRLKATQRISLADSILLAQAKVNKASVVSADHHEFDEIEKQKEIKFFWIR